MCFKLLVHTGWCALRLVYNNNDAGLDVVSGTARLNVLFQCSVNVLMLALYYKPAFIKMCGWLIVCFVCRESLLLHESVWNSLWL